MSRRTISFLALLLIPIVASPLSPVRASAACTNLDALFAPVVYYPTGTFTTSVASGDFNHDGVTDVALTNLNDNTVSILLGVPNGTFGAQVVYAAGSLPRGIAVGDFNGDSIPDLAVTNVGTQTVSILRGLGSGGHGNGTFAAPVSYGAGFENRGIAVADLNGDGHPDLVIAGRTSVAVLLNQFSGGSWGSFPSATLYPTNSTWGVALGDFDGNGIIDIAAGNLLTSTVTILLGNGGGTFHSGTTVNVPSGCADITSGDLNSDGIPDLVVAGLSGLWVLMGNGSGGLGNGTFTMSPYAQYGHQYNDVLIGDFNADGFKDLAATDTDGQRLVYAVGDGAGHFNDVHFYPAGNGPIGIASFDANHDQIADVFVALSASQNFPGDLAVFLGQCVGPEPPSITTVRDVPNDQGGKVFVAWKRARQDNPNDRGITGYRVWRRDLSAAPSTAVAPDLASFDSGRNSRVALRRAGPNGQQVVEYWEALATLPAAFLEGYAYTAPTVQDSLASGNPYTAFFIQALTFDPFVFFNSAPDSGYSVDNLAPAAPAPFTATYSTGSTALHWSRSAEPDFAVYRLYRGGSSNFAPGPSTFVVEKPDTGYTDAAGGPYFYKLFAVDVHGNTSQVLTAQPTGTTGVLGPAVPGSVWLGPAVPSPARQGTTVRFGVPRETRVSIAIYDASGRQVRSLLDGSVPAGDHSASWDGADVAGRAVSSGLYFIRLEAEGRVLRGRLVMVR